MVQPAPVAKLTNLPARPPTPPRESDSSGSTSADVKSHFLSGIFTNASPRGALTSTPDSSAGASNPLTGSSRKKVDFSPCVETKDPPKLSADGKHTPQSPLQSLPPSASRKPSKSILKPYNGLIDLDLSLGFNTKLSPPHTFPNLATMLESIVQQLAGKDRSSKMDAYMTLSNVLKASDNVPDVRALKTKMGLLEQFMQRDMSAKNLSGGPDTALAVQALVLLGSLLYKTAIAEMLSTDFAIFVVEHTLKTLETPQMSKDVAKHLMFIMSKQSFSHKVLNPDRVGKLIRAVHNVENHIKGKSISTGRIGVYRNLIRISSPLMIANTEWVEDLFELMFSSAKEVRNPAILFGQEAAAQFGTEPRVSRQIAELLSRGSEDSPRFAEMLSRRMKMMVEKKQDAVCVPQIWTVVILFLRAKPHQLEHWMFLRLWFQTLQPCFNSSDQSLRVEANLAWSRFIYATQPDEKSSRHLITTLSNPILGQFKRKNQKRSRQAAVNSLCTLLYYTFKPLSTAAQLDLYWDEYVVPFVKELTPAVGSDRPDPGELDLVCTILCGLFNLSTPRPWDEKRVLMPEPIKTNELPSIDSKWLRRNAARVFAVLEPLMERAFWQLAEEKSPITVLWNTYLKSIAAPAAKEIKVSLDTMGCIASLFNMLYKFWNKGPTGLQTISIGGTPEFLAGFYRLIHTTTAELGTLPFTEKLLSIGQQDTFVVIATPSHRPDKVRGVIKCPLHHLFVMFTNPSPGLQYDGSTLKVTEGFVPLNFRQVVGEILQPFYDARASSKSRLDFVGELIQLLPFQVTEQCGMLWRALADFATFAIDLQDESSSSSSNSYGRPLGAEYRQITSILEHGIETSPSVPLPGWKALFEALVTRVTTEAGDSGRAVAIIEPLAKALLPKLALIQHGTCGIGYCQILVSKATFPRDRQALDAARRSLWGTANVGPKTTTFDPYSNFYDYVGLCLETAYLSFTEDASSYSSLLHSISDLLYRCPLVLFPKAISRLQKGAASWISDTELKLTGRSFSEVSKAVASLWSITCGRIPLIAQQTGYSNLLDHMAVFLCSGLESKHRSIVNMAIQSWNATFGASKEELDYSQGLAKSLDRLRTIADLKLLNFPIDFPSEEEEDDGQLPMPTFPDTQNESFDFSGANSLESFMMRQRTPQLVDPSPIRHNRSTPRVLVEGSQSVSRKRIRDETPELSTRKASRRSVTPKLRHDDSQIHFAPIESSPIAEQVVESQILTDRQKEVKERQAEAAMMFPDLKSSPMLRGKSTPKSASKIEGLPIQLPNSAKRQEPVERPSTPTILPNAVFDDHITSSPTPARSLRSDHRLSQAPSLSPEPTTEVEMSDYSFQENDDIPSSPPVIPSSGREASVELGNDTTLSIDPSAQVDPYAVVHPSKLSTFQNAEETNSEESKPGNDTGFIDDSNTSPMSPTVQIARDVFLDAMSSPASSDKHTADEDVFLDAVSSPLRHAKAREPARHRTSSLSDLDEASMMRLMDKYDEDSDSHSKKKPESDAVPPTSSTSKESVEEELQQLPSSSPSDCIIVKIPDGYKVPDRPKRPIAVKASRRTRRSTSVLSQMSSMPETPDTKARNIDPVFVESRPSSNLRVVIPVSASRSSPRKPPSTRTSRTSTPIQSKRKYDETEQEIEVPDSQEAAVEVPAKKKSQSSTTKRRRGRSSNILPDQEAENSPTSIPASENLDINTSVQSPRKENLDGEDEELQEVEQAPPTTAVETDYGSTFLDEDAILQEDDTVESPILEGRPSEEVSKDILTREEDDIGKESENDAKKVEIMSGSSRDETGAETGPIVDMGPVACDNDTEMVEASPAAETREVSAPASLGLVARLRSIVSDLGAAALSREAFDQFDHLLWEAKGKIGLARRRGEDEGI